jgi:Tol biopolymer transport system component
LSFGPRFSGDARFVAFSSYVDGLVAGDANGKCDVFVRVLATQTTEIVSVDSHGSTGNGRSQSAVISRGGDWVAFESDATNLVASDGNGVTDVFLRDRGLGTTERVSVDSAGNEGDGPSAIATSGQGISADGRFVAIVSDATNLVANDTNGCTDVFVRDRTTGTTDRVSVDSAGGEANGFCSDAALSLDGRYVAFLSAASNLVASDANQRSTSSCTTARPERPSG